MRAEQIYDAITGLSDKLIGEAQAFSGHKKPTPWLKYTALAACATFAIGLGGMIALNGGFGGSTAGEGGGADGYGATGGASTFMSYAGPIFPMTLAEENDGITATRNVNLDFSPYIPYERSYTNGDGETTTYLNYGNEIIVTDSYTLTNTTDTNQTIELLYPVVGDLRSDVSMLPTITMGGETVETDLHFGAYSGGFQNVDGELAEESGEAFNLAYLDSWTDYDTLLSDGSYLQGAFDAPLDMSQSIIVYEFTDHYADFEGGVNPTLGVFYDMDYDETIILSYGFNGGSFDPEGGTQRRSYSIPDPNRSDWEESKYLIVIGDDIQNLTTQGYENGGCDAGMEIDSPSATMERYESTLGEMMSTLSAVYLEGYLDSGEDDLFDAITPEDYTGLCAQFLYSYGALSTDLIARYDFGMLEDILSEAATMDRVIYSSFTVTIPAGSTVEVVAQMEKESSYNYYGAGGDDFLHGYDLATQLGSNLTFTEQTASVDTHDQVEIVNQNFGFDVENGVTEVTLDPNEPHYYLEVYLKEVEE